MRGRKPDATNVVPLTADSAEGGAEREARFAARGEARALELRPRGMPPEVRRVWDRLAPIAAHPLRKIRLEPEFVETFALMCEVRARYERLRADLAENGDTYRSATRNGVQFKSRPEVGQLNETFRQFVTLARDFGLTPAAARGLETPGQNDLFDDGVPFA